MSMTPQIAFDELCAPLVESLILSLKIEDPWRLADSIVKATADRYDAAVSTLFQVDGEHLELRGGVLRLDGRHVSLPPHSYTLNWDAATWADLAGQGVTSGVAVFNEPLAIRSFDELRANPAHVGMWD